MQDIALTAAYRTPITGRSRALAGYGVDQLAAAVLTRLADFVAGPPDAVILGNCTGPGGNLGRRGALAAGFGTACVGWGIDGQCGSGLMAVQQAMHHVSATGTVVMAGGAESASTAPTRADDGTPFARARFTPPGFPDPDMLEAADALARNLDLTRERQEEYALRSHDLSRAERESIRAEILELAPAAGGPAVQDDGPRSLSSRHLRRFAPVVDVPGATVTPATTARISDGAAGVVVLPRSRAVGPHWRVRASTLAGGDPEVPGTVPVTSSRRAMKELGIGTRDLHAVEIVEAFASQTLATVDALGLAPRGDVDPRVNAWGGALALGHPWGASGAVGLVRLMHRLRHEGRGSLGLTTCAIGGGMGATMILEYTV